MRVCSRILVFLISVVFVSSVLAATRGESPLKEMKFAEFKELSGRFRQTKILKELDVEIKTEGRFQVTRPTAETSVFHWYIEKPKPSSICIDDVGIVIDSGNSAKRKSLKFSEVGQEAGDQIGSLFRIITMNQSRIVDEFTVQKHGSQFLLTPKNAERAFFETATLDINTAGLIKNVLVNEKSKDEIRIEFFGMKTEAGTRRKEDQCGR